MPSSRRQGQARALRGDGGFTLIELLVVIGIISVAGLFAYPLLYKPAPSLALDATVASVVSSMRMARGAAIRANTEHSMTLDVDQRRYWVDGLEASRSIPAGIAVRTTISQRELAGPRRARYRFFPDGTATGGQVVLSHGSRTAVVELDWLTGRVQTRWRR